MFSRYGFTAPLVVLVATVMCAPGAIAHDGPHAPHAGAPKRLPLGDNKVSSTPQRGHVLACRTTFPGGGGAHRVGGWVRDGYWYPDEKPQVEGKIAWPNAAIEVRVEGERRVVRANALPRHVTGVFPIRPGSIAYGYDRNPHQIGERAVLLDLPVQPVLLTQPACVPMGMIRFALTGVAIFGPIGSDGKAMTNAQLDECHGHTHEVEIEGRKVVTYHDHFTFEYPYTIGCFRAAPGARR